jgi:hypothetical protein
MSGDDVRKDSSFIASHTYDKDSGTLRVTLKNGNVYEHTSVPPEKYVAFSGAQSQGAYYNKKIKPNHPGRLRK